ncbi:unnamed protein product, partial [Discosporangium mesarthrocarpum]
RKRLSILQDVAAGMDYLYISGLQHRQLRSPNVLLTHGLKAKVHGAGLQMTMEMIVHCRSDNQAEQASDEGVIWESRELLAGAGFSEKSDVYSFGIIMWEILQKDGALPYAGLLASEVLGAKYTGKNPPIPKNCPPTLATLMGRCWSNLPGERPTFKEVCDLL